MLTIYRLHMAGAVVYVAQGIDESRAADGPADAEAAAREARPIAVVGSSKSAGEESFEELSASLHDEGRGYTGPVITWGGFEPGCEILNVLYETRVKRMYAVLAKRSPELAQRRVLELFDDKLTIYERALVAQMAFWKGDASPEQRRLSQRTDMRSNGLALNASLLLCAAFCEPQDALRAIDTAVERIDPLIRQLESEPQLAEHRPHARDLRKPSRLLILNLYLDLLNRNESLSVKELATVLDVSEQRVRLTPHRFRTWGQTSSGDDVEPEYRVVEIWSRLGVSWANSKQQQDVLDRLRPHVEKRLALDGGRGSERR